MIDFTLWPNTDGNLGNNKVQIPDGVTSFWPLGDALVGNFVYKDGKLAGMVDIKALIENEAKSTVIPYDFVDITLDKRLESLMTFNAGERCKHLNINYEVMLPEGYKRLEYLESTCIQYIVTGVKLSNESEVRCEYMATNGEFAINQALYGSFVIPRFSSYGLYRQGNQYMYYAYIGQDGSSKKFPISVGQKNTLVHNSKSITFNGQTKNFTDTTVFEQVVPCFLFGAGSMSGCFRVYSFSISRAGEMQVDYVPALDPTGAPCMYDIISQEPFYNKGTGQFLYPGAESQVVTSDLDENFYAKMTEHGIRRLYYVPENYSGSKDEYAIENGFKQLVEPPMPTEGYWIPQWTETDTQLICNWIETEAITHFELLNKA